MLHHDSHGTGALPPGDKTPHGVLHAIMTCHDDTVTPLEEHEHRERHHELALMRWHWDGAYAFDWRAGRYQAVRADNGRVVTAATAAAFREAVRMDYCHQHVPRKESP